MTVPQGYSQKLPPNTVCKLTKSIYGLKQDNRQLFEKLTSFLIQLRFKQSHVDTSLFTILHQGTLTFLLVYVEDILLVGKDSAFPNTIKQHLHHKFSIKDLGPIHYYLGIEFRWQWHKGSSLELSESASILDSKPIATPMDPIQILNDTDGYLLPDPSTYRTLVGKLIYLTITRPDLAFAAQALSQYSHSPRSSHFDALIRVLRYIKLCPGQGLFFPAKNTLQLTTLGLCYNKKITFRLCYLPWTKSHLLAIKETNRGI